MDLPPETLSHIFSFLNEQDVINCGYVCKSWSKVANNDDLLWKGLLIKKFKLHGTSPEHKSNSTSWKNEYLKLQKKAHDCKHFLDHLDAYLKVEEPGSGWNPEEENYRVDAVSYTHLTLPTIYSV